MLRGRMRVPSSIAGVIALIALGQVGCYYDVESLDAGAIEDLHVIETDLATDAGACTSRHSGELAEAEEDGGTSGWAVAPIPATSGTATLNLDPARKAAGAASLRLDTNASAAGYIYPEGRDADFDLFEQLYISFAVTADDSKPGNDPGWKGGEPHVFVVTTENDYYEYVPPDGLLSRTPGPFAATTVPLAGGGGWIRNANGMPDLHHVRYLAWTFSSWGAGFTVWLDDVQIGPGPFADCVPVSMGPVGEHAR